jgi:hypothetical protein
VVSAAETTDQLDALQAQTQDPAMLQAIAQRREELGAITARQRRATVAATSTDVGPNAVTDPAKPKDHYFEVDNGDGTFRKVNAWGEEKGSPEDKKRW